MFVEAGGRPPDPPPGRPRRHSIPWQALRWPAVVLALFVASLLTSGWVGVAFVYAALFVACWRGARLLGPHAGTMKDYSQ